MSYISIIGLCLMYSRTNSNCKLIEIYRRFINNVIPQCKQHRAVSNSFKNDRFIFGHFEAKYNILCISPYEYALPNNIIKMLIIVNIFLKRSYSQNYS